MGTYNVVYLPTARRQLTDAVVYIASSLGAPDAAESLLREVDEKVLGLEETPYRYALYPLPFAMKREIRCIPVNGYLIFYTVKETEKIVEVWRFLHHRQRISSRML